MSRETLRDPLSPTAQPAASPAERLGQVFCGNYRVDSVLGEGAMGVVYRAHQLSIQRDVVVKMLKRSPHDAELNELLAKRFRREAVATGRLNHPNSVQILDFGQSDDGEMFIVLELLEGADLADLLAEAGTLPTQRVARIARQVCRSLHEAHAAGVIHRDLKPENIFLCRYPEDHDVVKVMDFGVARLVPHTDQHITRITAAGLTVGTPMYIAPEQASGKETSAATDLYALGVVLFEALTGRGPFAANSAMEMAIKHIREPAPPLALPGDVAPEVAIGWQALIGEMLEKRPTSRPRSAAAVERRLAALQAMERTGSAPLEPAVIATAPVPASTSRAPLPEATEAVPAPIARAKAPVHGRSGVALIAALTLVGAAIGFALGRFL